MEDELDNQNRAELNILEEEEEKFRFGKSIEKEEVIIYFPEDSTVSGSPTFVPDEDVPLNYEIKANGTDVLPAAASSWTISGYKTIQNIKIHKHLVF